MNTLVLLLALAAAPHIPPSLDLSGGTSSTPNGIADFSAHGAGLPPWAPTPALALDGAAYRPGDTTWPNGGSLGGSLTKIGSPAAWYGSPFYPDGFEEQTRYGATSFASGSKYELASGVRFASDFWSCSIVRPNSTLTQAAVIGSATTTTGGWVLRLLNWTSAIDLYNASGSVTTVTFPVLPLNGSTSVVCVWRIGSTVYAQVNAGTVTSGAAGTAAAGTGATTIGTAGTAFPFDGAILEVISSGSTTTAQAMLNVQLAAMRCAGGTCLTEDAGTVSHVTFDASANAVDSKGLTWTKNGTPTALQVPIVWPNNRSPLAQPAVASTASGSYFTAGDAGDLATVGTFLHVFRLDDVSAANYMISKFSGSGGWMVYAPANYLTMRVCTATPTCANTVSFGTVEAKAWYVLAGSYLYDPGAGTSVVYSNLNGVATSSTGFLGPIPDTATAMQVPGEVVTGGQHVASSYIWTNWAANPAELDGLVRWKMGLAPQKPGSFESGNVLVNASKMNTGASYLSPWGLNHHQTVLSDGDVSPAGTVSTRSTDYSGVLGAFGVYQGTAISSATKESRLAFSAKAGTRTCIGVSFSNTRTDAKFNLATGAVGYSAPGITAKITSLPAGWYRVEIAGALPAAGTYYPEVFGATSCTNSDRQYTGSGAYFDVADADFQSTTLNAVSFSRNDAHSACCPISDASCHKLGANMPCITSRGLERAGPTSNLLATSVDLGSWVTWSPGHVAPVRTSNTTETTDPLGTNTAAKVVFPAVAAGQISLLVSPQFAQTAVPYSFGLWARVPSGTWRTYLSCYSTGYYAVREITVTPVWQRIYTTGTSPGAATQSCSIGTDLNAPAPGETATDAGTVYLWAGQAQQTSVLGAYRAATGTPYSGPHTDATVPWVNRNPDRWAFSILGTIAANGTIRMLGGGVGGSGGNVEFYMNAANYLIHQPTDGLGGYRTWSQGIYYAAASQKLYTAFVAGGEPGAMIDGERITGSLSNSWSGSIRFNPATLRFGSFGATGSSFPIEGHVKRVVQCPTERNCR